MLQWTRKGNMHFILSHVLGNERTVEFFKNDRRYKMLDNGCYEHGFPLATNELLDIAKATRTDEIVCPDFFRERKETYRATKEFLSVADKGYKYAVVPQAKTPLEWVEAYQDMVKLDVNVIAVPIWLQKQFKSRPAVIGYIRAKKMLDPTKELHLLGLDNYGELYSYEPGIIRSVDTSLPFSLTHSNIWESCFGVIKHERVPMNRQPFAKMQERMLTKHISELMEAASYA